MKFSVTGIYEGRKSKITWENGGITSEDRELVDHAIGRAQALEELGQGVGPVCGPYVEKDILKDPVGALFIIRGLMSSEPDVRVMEGNFKEIPHEEGVIS